MSLDTEVYGGTAVKEIFVEVTEDKVDGGYTASAIGVGIHTQGETLEEVKRNILEAVDCHFDKPEDAPTVICLRGTCEEVIER
jgi:predicted RNase H-like HicB family nuclease